MRKTRRLSSMIILMVLVLVGCIPQAATPVSIASISPTTDTPAPPPIHSPTAKTPPTATPGCNPDAVLAHIKANLPFEQAEVYYNSIQGTASLVIWYVDPEIDPDAGGAEIEPNARLAMRNAALTSQQLARQNPCIERLFTVINPIVVDRNYNGWFAAQVGPSILPDSEIPSDSELDSIQVAFDIGYFRTNPTAPLQPAQSGSCTWPETRVKLQRHFSPERENVGFYFVIDDAGVNVWAQWDGPTDFLAMASMLNVAMELECLHPAPTQLIMIIVDGSGEIGLIGILPSDGLESLDLNRLQIVYQN